jgi:hypothetical protein
MSEPNDDRSADPPHLARLALRVCCAPARIEEIEGDLCEIYARRRARSGDKRARIGYVLDVCLRQVFARMAVRPAGSTLIRAALTVYPGRIRACLILTAALLVLLQARWAGIAPSMLFVIDGVFELIVLASAAISLTKQLVLPAARDDRAGRVADAVSERAELVLQRGLRDCRCRSIERRRARFRSPR